MKLPASCRTRLGNHSNPSLQCANMFQQFFFLVTFIFSVQCAPIDSRGSNETKTGSTYDLSQFDEVYDQKQNGTENWRIDVNKVVLVWTPPGNLLTAAMLLDPSLYEPEMSENDEDFFKPGSSTQKPEVTTAGNEQSSSEAVTTAKASKRRLRISELLRPFVRRRHTQHL